MTDKQPDPTLAILTSIANSLAVLADYIEARRIAESGERTHEIGGYVRSSNAGGELVYLYASHPKLDKRVSTVYAERWAELPFDPTGASIYTGETAPSKAFAIKSGAYNSVPAFKIVISPTGKMTDAGLAVYRFSRVLGQPVMTDDHGGEPDPFQEPAKEQKAPPVKAPAAKRPNLATDPQIDLAKKLIRLSNKGASNAELHQIAGRWAHDFSKGSATTLQDMTKVEAEALIKKLKLLVPSDEQYPT